MHSYVRKSRDDRTLSSSPAAMQREIYRDEKDRVRHDVESDGAAEGWGGVVRPSIFFHLLANFPKFDGLQVALSCDFF